MTVVDDKDKVYVELTVTNSCNCNCSYCFEGCNHTSVVSNPEVEKQLLKFIIDYCKMFKDTKFKQFGIGFWGGEPFMNVKFLNEIVAATSPYDFVRYHCYSNGVLIDLYKEFLKQPFIESIKDRINILLSYDGEPHNILKRGYSKDNIYEIADMLQEAGLPFTFKATLAYDMIPCLVDIWKSYEELFYRYPNAYIRYVPTLDSLATDGTMLEIWKQKVEEVAKLEYDFSRKNGFPLWDWFSSTTKMICKLKNVCMIHTDGNVYPCHGTPYLDNKQVIKNLTLGNIYTDSLADIISKTENSQHISEKCLKCSSTYCSVCHVINLKETDSLIEGWTLRRSDNQAKCKYFQEFSYISKLLKFALLKQQSKYLV